MTKASAALTHKSDMLATLANDFDGLIQAGEFTEALGLVRIIARLRIELESLIEVVVYDDNVAKGFAA